MAELDDRWVPTAEEVGPTCPFGHPWNTEQRLVAAEQLAQAAQAVKEADTPNSHTIGVELDGLYAALSAFREAGLIGDNE